MPRRHTRNELPKSSFVAYVEGSPDFDDTVDERLDVIRMDDGQHGTILSRCVQQTQFDRLDGVADADSAGLEHLAVNAEVELAVRVEAAVVAQDP